MDDLLFISALGPDGNRDVNLARFNEDPNSKVPTLRVVEWDEDDTTFHMLRTSAELDRLEWRKPDESLDRWRERWAARFSFGRARSRHSEGARLADGPARHPHPRTVNDAMAVEGETGPLRKMFKAFREVLLHDLTEDGFADMYAQTITYGLFAARRSRPMGITLETRRTWSQRPTRSSATFSRSSRTPRASPKLSTSTSSASTPSSRPQPGEHRRRR